jgi:hypothetical protein
MFTPSTPGPRPGQAVASRARPDPPRQDPGVRPPDPARSWTAEIRWRDSGEESRFCVVAPDRQAGGATVIARSEPLDWPPADTNAVQALVNAADALTEALVSTGWKPLPPGTAWFEKRFEWVPVPTSGGWAPPRPPRITQPKAPAPVDRSGVPKRRFRSATQWPEGTERLWRCEIKWKPGYARSRFEVDKHDPVRGNDRVMGRSAPFKWLWMADPDVSGVAFHQALRDLVTALESAGWERVGTGAAWYAVRFIWRADQPPPDRIEPTAATAGRAS